MTVKEMLGNETYTVAFLSVLKDTKVRTIKTGALSKDEM